MLRNGFCTACTVPLPLLGSVAPAEDLRCHQTEISVLWARNAFRCAEVLLQPKTHELPDGDISTVGAKCFRCAEVLLQSEEIGLCATGRGVMKFCEAGAALVQDLGADCSTQPNHVAIITPVIHYCMGGLEIDKIQQCYAAGEVAGDVHGNNLLRGNSLCAVHVGRQGEGNFSCGACWWRQG